MNDNLKHIENAIKEINKIKTNIDDEEYHRNEAKIELMLLERKINDDPIPNDKGKCDDCEFCTTVTEKGLNDPYCYHHGKYLKDTNGCDAFSEADRKCDEPPDDAICTREVNNHWFNGKKCPVCESILGDVEDGNINAVYCDNRDCWFCFQYPAYATKEDAEKEYDKVCTQVGITREVENTCKHCKHWMQPYGLNPESAYCRMNYKITEKTYSCDDFKLSDKKFDEIADAMEQVGKDIEKEKQPINNKLTGKSCPLCGSPLDDDIEKSYLIVHRVTCLNDSCNFRLYYESQERDKFIRFFNTLYEFAPFKSTELPFCEKVKEQLNDNEIKKLEEQFASDEHIEQLRQKQHTDCSKCIYYEYKVDLMIPMRFCGKGMRMSRPICPLFDDGKEVKE